MNRVRIIGVVDTSAIPPQKRVGGRNGGRNGGTSIFTELLDRLANLPPGKALVVEHDADSHSEFHGRLASIAHYRKIGKIKIHVRGKKAYIHRKP